MERILLQLTRRMLMTSGAAGAAVAACSLGKARAATTDTDVIVIGAGLSGLNAAMILEDVGIKPLVIEGADRVGGRVFTAEEEDAPGRPEWGASGIGGHYASIRAAADRFGVKLVEERHRTTAPQGELMYYVRGQAIKVEDWETHAKNPFTGEVFRSTPLHLFQFSTASLEDNPLPKGDFEAWQNGDYAAHDISVYDYLRSRGVSDDAIKLGAGTNMSYGTHERDLSMLMGYQSRNLIGSLYGGASTFDRTPRAGEGGNQRVPEAIANGLKTEVRLNEHVTGIRSLKEGVEVHTRAGKIFKARFCICTMPFSALRLVHMDPVFEGLQAEAVQTLGYTPVFQAHFQPTRKFWEMDGLPPSMWTDRTPGRFMTLRSDPSRPGEVTSCLAFVNGQMALYLDRLHPDDAVALILSELAEMRPSTKGALKAAKAFSWNRTPFAGGAYAYWKPGQITRFSKEMRAPWKRVHFAGEHTAVINRGMEGAMESGERAAFEVLERL